MVERGQVELFGAGDTEPVLAAIPERDRVGQIRALSDKLEREFGQRPDGAWLTERVWEATVVPALAGCGIRYVTVDDYHFLCAGKSEAELTGYFTTEEDGQPLDLFPISEALRYRIPFSPAPEAVAYIESLGDRGAGTAAIYFDDIEKFGIWPETYEWVYDKGWLDAFIEGVLASDRIETRTFRDFHAAHRTRGVVYLPTTSYIEMNEWTLPAPAAHDYATLVAREKEAGRYEREKAFLRGGIWRNFLSRYPEANWMHKRMLGLSARLAALETWQRTPEMQHLLHLAQANDAYWHGLFGGLYLPHLRRGIYYAMLRLESVLDRVEPRAAREQLDLDTDGVEEVILQNGELQVIVRLDGAASVVELDSYALAQNFGDTLRRHAEHYHRKALAAGGSQHAGEGIASAHDRVTFKHPVGPDDLATDAHGRTIFRDAWVDADGAAHPIDGYVVQPHDGFEYALRFRAPCGRWRRRQADPDAGRPRHRVVQLRGIARGAAAYRDLSCDAKLRRVCRAIRPARGDSGGLRSGARRRGSHRVGARRSLHAGVGRDSHQSPCARARAATAHRLAVGGRVREDHAVRGGRARVADRGEAGGGVGDAEGFGGRVALAGWDAPG